MTPALATLGPREAPCPSRDSNPFSTCWTRPGALPFVFPVGRDADTMVDALASHGWRGQLCGPHGVGKTTLLVALRERLLERGVRVIEWPAPVQSASIGHGGEQAVWVVDGFERFNALRRCWVTRQARSRGLGLLVTTHRPARLPMLASWRPDDRLVLSLFDTLTERRPTPLSHADALACWRRSEGNLRETWFDLYDLHEQAVRSSAARF
ncbi:hypothetical protein Mal64_03900 [Pseudobythopirellula maris]|uniref:AAA+ ATPase domain-containing protein n=1 Tax=Pseudobythopirellula maris TaxID=2527991 RepID=A0A5C5ZSG3_9BACT|nr:hypothetical protein [Pseudobythopirellula maris]TWT90008.1 hypothetical protein Mal64_03900 [Pseudobythopirellula maris]